MGGGISIAAVNRQINTTLVPLSHTPGWTARVPRCVTCAPEGSSDLMSALLLLDPDPDARTGAPTRPATAERCIRGGRGMVHGGILAVVLESVRVSTKNFNCLRALKN